MSFKHPEFFLFPLEVLEAAARKTRSQGDRTVALVEELLEQEVERFRRWQDSVEVNRLLEALKASVEQIRRQQIERYGKNLSEEQNRQLEEFTTGLLQSILDDVTGNFKNINLQTELGAKEFDLIQNLFNIRQERDQ